MIFHGFCCFLYSTVTDFRKTTKKYFISFIYRHKSSDFISKKVLDTQHQKLHNLIWKLKSQGFSYRKISKYLNENNIRSHTNKEFYPSLVSRIYKGIEKREIRNNTLPFQSIMIFRLGIIKNYNLRTI